MQINLYDVREVLDEPSATYFTRNLSRIFTAEHKQMIVPTVMRGKQTTMTFPIAHYNLEDAIEYMSKPYNNKYISESRKKHLSTLLKIKENKND